MSGAVTAAAVVGGAMLATSVYQADRQHDAQYQAQQQAKQQAQQQADQAKTESDRLIQQYQQQTDAYKQQASIAAQQIQDSQQAFNRANQKRPNSGQILSAISAAARGGQSGTMLTGPQGAGVDPSALGKNTLLGQ